MMLLPPRLVPASAVNARYRNYCASNRPVAPKVRTGTSHIVQDRNENAKPWQPDEQCRILKTLKLLHLIVHTSSKKEAAAPALHS